METHWDRTWRRFSEAFEKQRRRDMNETRRDDTTRRDPAADAVERAAKAMFTLEKDASGALVQWDDLRVDSYGRKGVAGKAVYRNLARAALAAVEPEPGLDELLDDVEAAFVSILWREDVGRHEVVMHGHSSAWFARGTGKTRTEALAAAVQQAKENGDG